MLTRLKIDGFKNLSGIDIHFGPLTCIAGVNGVGKSNLFDAIHFLALLADHTLLEAAAAVRSEGERAPDVRLLFRHCGEDFATDMSFEAEMLVPETSVDDLGQEGRAKSTFLVYRLGLRYRDADGLGNFTAGGIEIVKEELTYIPKGEARNHLRFPHEREWCESVVKGASRSPFISTEIRDQQTLIKLHQDGNQGRPTLHPAQKLPRTVLSRASASESPTALCARREMASWAMLQLEPSAVRRPSPFSGPDHLGMDGAHLPAALHRIAYHETEGTGLDAEAVMARVANRLSELIGGVHAVSVDRDDKRELLTLMLKDSAGTQHPAHSLSDGTLRFLALAVIELDPESGGAICLEEPENGIHPERIAAMLRLLGDIAVDTSEPVDRDNPMRQVLINTHSPVVVGEVQDSTLLVAEHCKAAIGRSVRFGCVEDTWRSQLNPCPPVIPRGALLGYLGEGQAEALQLAESVTAYSIATSPPEKNKPRVCKVKERMDLRFLPGAEAWR